MGRNEAETRYELIDPVLRDKGYRVPYIRLETPAPVEPTGPKGVAAMARAKSTAARVMRTLEGRPRSAVQS